MSRSGTGTTATFATTGFNPDIRSFSGLGMEREEYDCTHMLSAESVQNPGIIFREFTPGDLGTLSLMTIGFLFDPDLTSLGTIISSDPEQVTIQWRTVGAQSTGASWVFTAFCVSWNVDVTYDGLMEGEITLRPSGDVTWTAGS